MPPKFVQDVFEVFDDYEKISIKLNKTTIEQLEAVNQIYEILKQYLEKNKATKARNELLFTLEHPNASKHILNINES